MHIPTLRLFALLLLTTAPLAAQPPKPMDRPLPPKDSAKAMTVPPGFKATLFAGEPDVVQPIAMTFDDRGRLWVVECLSYPKWATDGKGTDRVVILEDTDGDGVHDKRTVFLDNGVNLSGIEYGFGGIWLCSSPNLVFVPIKDGEDKPAGPPQVILDGWNIKDTKHNIFNSLIWGPDGWLYGLNGIQAKARVGKPGTPDKDRTPLDCGVWRYHPTRKVFEAVAWGTTNPFGLDFDDYGQMFMTNCVIDHLWHVIPGGHYQRMYGEDLNPHTYGLMKSCCDHLHWGGGAWTSSRSTGINGDPKHSEAGGGHAHSGCLVYLGDNFPAEYRNNVFMCNIHGNRLNRDKLVRTDSGYVAKHAPDFLFANDSWFRGICVKSGPDGGLYVSDWTDTGECHNYDKVDLTNGRVFKVVYGTPKSWKGDISKLPDAELVKLQLHKNDWFCRKARRVLQERTATRDAKVSAALREQLLGMLKENADPTRMLRAMWTLNAIGQVREEINDWVKHDDENVRAWAILLVYEKVGYLKPDREAAFAQDSSPLVLATFAGAMHRYKADGFLTPGALIRRTDIPAEDEHLCMMIWYALQSYLQVQPLNPEYNDLARMNVPGLRRKYARFMIASGNATERSSRLTMMMGQMIKQFHPDWAGEVLVGIQEALAGVREFPEPKGWSEAYAQLKQHPKADVRQRAEALAVLFGNKDAIAELTARVNDPKAEAKDRISAIELLVRRKIDGFAPVLQGLLSDPAVRGAAIKALATYTDDSTPAAILKNYSKFSTSEKTDAVQSLASRPKWANALLEAIEKGAIPRADVPLVAARQIIALNDKATTDRLEKVWGKIQPASKEKAALIKQYKAKLPSEEIKKADLANGRVLFTKHCASCHKLFGEGSEIGPDLTGSQRVNIDYVLENVLDPSAVVPREFQITNFTLTDGRLVSAIILKETPDGLTVRTVNDTVVIPKADIETRKLTNQSIMPDGLLDMLKPDEVRDLIAYLATPHQVPLKK